MTNKPLTKKLTDKYSSYDHPISLRRRHPIYTPRSTHLHASSPHKHPLPGCDVFIGARATPVQKQGLVNKSGQGRTMAGTIPSAPLSTVRMLFCAPKLEAPDSLTPMTNLHRSPKGQQTRLGPLPKSALPQYMYERCS